MDAHSVQALDETDASIEEITQKVEEMTGALTQFTVPTLTDFGSVSNSLEVSDRVKGFNTYVQRGSHYRSLSRAIVGW
jgi:hypothetical protein